MRPINFVDIPKEFDTLQKKIINSITKVIHTESLVSGNQVDLFEREFAKYLRIRHCITVNSGTDALILGMRSLELNHGSEVLIPANTFIATALAATENGLKPVFVDCDEQDNGINLQDLDRKINSRTKAVILVHLFGQADKIDEVLDIIEKSGKKIMLIEDASQAHGAKYKDKFVGNYGVFSVFSFYPTKNLGAYGDGGAIVTSDNKLKNKIRLLRQYGQEKKYFHKILGVNSRLDTVQATVLRAKLPFLNAWNRKRQLLAHYYTKLLNASCTIIKTPQTFADRKSVYYAYTVRAQKRNRLSQYLKSKNIPTVVHYPIPLHLQEAFSYLKYQKGDLPLAEKIASEIISLPLHPFLSKTQIKYIVWAISRFYKR